MPKPMRSTSTIMKTVASLVKVDRPLLLLFLHLNLIVHVVRQLLREERGPADDRARVIIVAGHRMDHKQLLFRARDRDIEKPSLLLELPLLDHRFRMRELPFGQADQKHDPPLEPLGLMDRREDELVRDRKSTRLNSTHTS